MFGSDQKERLLRESWTADALAQELYAMFGDQVPNDTSAPININLPPGTTVAPITITGAPSDGSSVITINRNDGTTVSLNSDGSVTSTPPQTDPSGAGGSFGGGGGNQGATLVTGDGSGGDGVAPGGGSGGSVIPVWG